LASCSINFVPLLDFFTFNFPYPHNETYLLREIAERQQEILLKYFDSLDPAPFDKLRTKRDKSAQYRYFDRAQYRFSLRETYSGNLWYTESSVKDIMGLFPIILQFASIFRTAA